jgi:hypothetical protein
MTPHGSDAGGASSLASLIASVFASVAASFPASSPAHTHRPRAPASVSGSHAQPAAHGSPSHVPPDDASAGASRVEASNVVSAGGAQHVLPAPLQKPGTEADAPQLPKTHLPPVSSHVGPGKQHSANKQEGPECVPRAHPKAPPHVPPAAMHSESASLNPTVAEQVVPARLTHALRKRSPTHGNRRLSMRATAFCH